MGKKQKHTRTDDKAKSRTMSDAAHDPDSETEQTGYDRHAQSSDDKTAGKNKSKGR